MTTALVTGASSGIGAAFARALRDRGARVVLVGRAEARLVDVLGPESGAVELLAADLSTPAGLARVAGRLAAADRPVDLLVHAAGCTTSRPFGVETLAAEQAQVRLNVSATLDVLHAAVRAMSARGGGAVVTVGSTAALWSLGSYAASKSWQANLTRAIAERAGETGVRALLLVPGFTRTELHVRAGVDASRVPRWMWLDPDTVAAEGLRALDAGRRVWVPTRRYRLLTTAVRILPVRRRVRLLRRLAPLQADRTPTRGATDARP